MKDMECGIRKKAKKVIQKNKEAKKMIEFDNGCY